MPGLHPALATPRGSQDPAPLLRLVCHSPTVCSRGAQSIHLIHSSTADSSSSSPTMRDSHPGVALPSPAHTCTLPAHTTTGCSSGQKQACQAPHKCGTGGPQEWASPSSWSQAAPAGPSPNSEEGGAGQRYQHPITQWPTQNSRFLRLPHSNPINSFPGS